MATKQKKGKGSTELAVKPKLARGRPSLYSTGLADYICEQIAGGSSLSSICKVEGMPSMTAVFSWLSKHEDFANNYARSTKDRTEALIEQAFDIARDGSNDWIEDNYMEGKTPGYALNGENIQRSRLQVDLIKWYASKMLPKKYGDKMDMTTNGKDLPTPILGVFVNNAKAQSQKDITDGMDT